MAACSMIGPSELCSGFRAQDRRCALSLPLLFLRQRVQMPGRLEEFLFDVVQRDRVRDGADCCCLSAKTGCHVVSGKIHDRKGFKGPLIPYHPREGGVVRSNTGEPRRGNCMVYTCSEPIRLTVMESATVSTGWPCLSLTRKQSSDPRRFGRVSWPIPAIARTASSSATSRLASSSPSSSRVQDSPSSTSK